MFVRNGILSLLLPLLIAIQAGCASVSERVAETPAASARFGVIPLYISANRPVALMRIDGRHPIPVVFDTGTGGNALDRDYASRERLPRVGSSTIVDGTTGASFEAPTVRLSDARLSGISVGDPTADVYEYLRDDAVGLIGPNIFTGSLVYLELARNRIRLREKTPATIPAGTVTPMCAPQAATSCPRSTSNCLAA